MKQVLIIAGEVSGDKHAAYLIRESKLKIPDIHFFGMGGKEMQAAGAEIILNCDELAILGFYEVLTHWRKIKSAFNIIKNAIVTRKPDLVILVDYAGFNLRVAKFAKEHHCQTLYYISPKVWAWNQGRIKKIRQYVDRMAVIFPFEVNFYRQHNIPAIYVGNSLFQHTKSKYSKAAAKSLFNIAPEQLTIGILAGSRKSEIKHIFSTLLATSELLKKQHPNIQFILPLAASISEEELVPYLEKHKNLPIQIIHDQFYDVLQACDAAICVSGTATLEVALMQVPFVIVYRLSIITALIGWILVRVDMIGLCNIVYGKKFIPELIQFQATPKNISAEIMKIISDPATHKKMVQDLKNFKQQVVDYKTEITVADLVCDMLKCQD